MRRTIARWIAVASLAALPGAAAAQEGGGARDIVTMDSSASEGAKPFAQFSRSALSLRDSIVALARAQLGRRYVRGGESPKRGFDCSGLIQYIASALHITVPRTARQQATVGAAVPADTAALLPGDLLTFGRGKRISHIGIYVGNGRFIHASTKAGRVIETNLIRPPAAGIKPWRGARRLVLSDSVPPSAPADSAS
ncbi:MAG: C40 family peptidase [Gemmatimonadaceae bacterium]|nr:C40 family peptidase [Gemmatimonadaceae bacterium]